MNLLILIFLLCFEKAFNIAVWRFLFFDVNLFITCKFLHHFQEEFSQWLFGSFIVIFNCNRSIMRNDVLMPHAVATFRKIRFSWGLKGIFLGNRL